MNDSTKHKIDACFSPHLYPVYADKESIVVVIDVFRATSAICVAFHNGADKIIPVATVEEAMQYKKKGFLAGAERDALKLDGFDFGNSPYDYMGAHVKGKTIALTTTNGTQAIDAARNAYKVVIGSFLNIDVLCAWLIKQNRGIILLCSGWKNKFNLEDALYAGAITEKIFDQSDKFTLGDGCLALKYLYQQAKHEPIKFLVHASHKERLARLGLKKDIKLCLTPNQAPVIPILEGKYLVKLKIEILS
ncbi:MAG TPA: 2-phosphosulfolactate phosphatase [Bacteroidia bacterium]|nr:2-phosphosulfolactate phosphatase [Bacteroidia bacterium]